MTSSNENILRVTDLSAGNSSVPVNFPHKGQWRGTLMFSLICARINCWVNNREAGDFRRHRTLYDVIEMQNLLARVYMAPPLNRTFARMPKPGSLRTSTWNTWQITASHITFYWLWNKNCQITRRIKQHMVDLVLKPSKPRRGLKETELISPLFAGFTKVVWASRWQIY